MGCNSIIKKTLLKMHYKKISNKRHTIKALNFRLFIWWLFKPSKYRTFWLLVSKGMSINAVVKKLK